MVVLGTEEEVDREYSNSSACDDHQTVADEEEAEHVVYPREPDRVHDEVQLDKDGAPR